MLCRTFLFQNRTTFKRFSRWRLHADSWSHFSHSIIFYQLVSIKTLTLFFYRIQFWKNTQDSILTHGSFHSSFYLFTNKMGSLYFKMISKLYSEHLCGCSSITGACLLIRLKHDTSSKYHFEIGVHDGRHNHDHQIKYVAVQLTFQFSPYN